MKRATLDRAAGRLTLMAFAIAGVMLVGGCQAKDSRVTISSTPDLAGLRPDAAFTCAKEADHIPARDPEADQLYQHARWLRRNNLLKDDPSVSPAIERLVRVATAHGHDKANLALRGMLKNGQAQSPNPIKESVGLVEDLIKRGIPGGYHDMGNYLMQGYGVVGDFDLGKRYYRKAADLGSPDAQYLIGDKLIDTRRHPPEVVEIGLQMLRCAAEQGHAEAALGLGVYIYEEKPEEAMEVYQWGAKAGHAQSASRLAKGFKLVDPTEIGYLGLEPDLERVRRYKIIWEFLSDYEYLDPKVPEIDEIVPLPPAKLPPWDGKFKWLEEHKANVPPPLPPEKRIEEMARAKGLDPKTGRPIQAGQ
ncbi:SEL1-like repeat protein [Aquabacterium parvum]|uniref:SEL1-like repeat protein n=1 Tax=Aquabacterium parvum TaxID=70584 RepID=UPI000718C2C4|nr:sel1 repeat family protein [Aquabacterium parvum]